MPLSPLIRPPSIPFFSQGGSQPSPGPSPEEATAAFQLGYCTLSQPFLWLGQICPILSLLKGPTRIVALLRKRKFFS